MNPRALILLVAMFAGVSALRFGVEASRALSSRSTPLRMGLFDQFFGPKRTASASHILMKDLRSLERVKTEISGAKDLKEAFAAKALALSTCPSSRKGGDLGTFSQGQMVPAFDKVVFNEAVGVVHGPVTTPFGYHLILINERSDPSK